MTDHQTGSAAGQHHEQHGSHEEPVGSLAEEAVKLFGAVSGWAREQGHDLGHGVEHGIEQGLAGAAGAFRSFDEHLATGAPECTSCPVCRAVHGFRQLNPEVKASLATAATSLLEAAAGLLATVVPEPSAAPSERPAPDPRDGVEHIDLDDLHDLDDLDDTGDPGHPDGSAP